MATSILLDVIPQTSASKVMAYSAGAQVNGDQRTAVTTVTVHAGHGIVADDLFLYAITEDNISFERIFTATSVTATTVNFTPGFSFPDKAVLVNLETDTVVVNSDGSWPLPNYDGSDITMYSDPAGNDAITSRPVRPDGEIQFWADMSPMWVLSLTQGNRPVRIYRDIGASMGTVTFVQDATPTGATLGNFWLKIGTTGNPSILYVYAGQGDDTDDWTEVIRGQSV